MTTYLIRHEIIARNPVFWDLPMFFDVEGNPLYKQVAVWVMKDLGTLRVGIPYSDLDGDSMESAKLIADHVVKSAIEAVDKKKSERVDK